VGGEVFDPVRSGLLRSCCRCLLLPFYCYRFLPDVWVYRYTDSAGKKRSIEIGDLDRYPRKAQAAQECQKLLAHLQTEPYRAMLMVAMCLGLRCSEWAALQWQDVDFDAGTISISRAIVVNHGDDVKTVASGKTLPLHPMLARTLRELRNRSQWRSPSDWVFANPHTQGLKPYQPWKYAALEAGLAGC